MVELDEEQKRIVKYVRNGLTNIEIAEELGYSPDTIKKRLVLLYKLFNVNKRIELVNKLIRYNIIEIGLI